MSILQKYVLREWFWTLLAVTIVLMIVLLGVFLGEMLNDIAGGRMPPSLLGAQLILYFPEALGTILPLSGFVAILWGLGRLYRDQEMSVMRSNGFQWQHMLRPLFILVGPLAVILLVLELSLAPKAAAMAEHKVDEAFRSAAIWGLQPGQFHVLQGGELVLYIEDIDEDGRTLRNIFMQQRRNGREQVWMAERGQYWYDELTDSRYLTLEDGQITDSEPGRLDMRVLRFGRNDLKLPEPEPRRHDDELKTQSSSELLADRNAASMAELQWRLSPSVAVIVLGLMAIPLSHSDPREGRGGRVVLGIFTYSIYANLLYVSRAWTADGTLPQVLGMWWVHLMALGLVLLWLQRQGRMPRRRQSGRQA